MSLSLAKPVRIARGFDERGLDHALLVQVPLLPPGQGLSPRFGALVAVPGLIDAPSAAPSAAALTTPLAHVAAQSTHAAAVRGDPDAWLAPGPAQVGGARPKGLVLVTALKLLVGLAGAAVATLLAWYLVGEPTAPVARQWLDNAQARSAP